MADDVIWIEHSWEPAPPDHWGIKRHQGCQWSVCRVCLQDCGIPSDYSGPPAAPLTLAGKDTHILPCAPRRLEMPEGVRWRHCGKASQVLSDHQAVMAMIECRKESAQDTLLALRKAGYEVVRHGR